MIGGISLVILILKRKSLFKYLNGPNPLGQMFYLLLSGLVTYGFYGTQVYDEISNTQRSIGIILILMSNLSFIVASATDPGVIRKTTLQIYQNMYHYDYVLYSPRNCRTCKFLKVARSKHCSVCDRCIARQDHHCIWLNNCVGLRNFKWFVWFLWRIIGLEFLMEQRIMVSWNSFTMQLFTFIRRLSRADYFSFAFLRYLFSLEVLRDLFAPFRDRPSKYPLETGWVVFNILASIIVLMFSLFALYPSIFKGMTLNESIKWEELEESLHVEAVEMESLILECNQKNTYITKEILEKAVESKEKALINSIKQLRNIYDHGICENLKEMVFKKY